MLSNIIYLLNEVEGAVLELGDPIHEVSVVVATIAEGVDREGLSDGILCNKLLYSLLSTFIKTIRK